MPDTASYGLHFASISDGRLYLLAYNEIRANLGQIPERHTNGYLQESMKTVRQRGWRAVGKTQNKNERRGY